MSSGRSPADSWQASGTILAVEDEVLTRMLIRRTLEQHGFDVLEAANGREALSTFERHQADIRAVLLDLSLQRSRGQDSVPELRRIRPDVCIVVISGHSEEVVTKLLGGQAICGFVRKPFGVTTLLGVLRECLEP